MNSIVATVKDLTNMCQLILLAAILKQELPLSEGTLFGTEQRAISYARLTDQTNALWL